MEIVEIGDRLYVPASAALAGQGQRVLKCDDTFGVFDPQGNIRQAGLGRQGLYHLDTRHLSRLELRLDGAFPLFLGSSVGHGGALLSVDLALPDLEEPSSHRLHLFRGRYLEPGLWRELLRFTSYVDRPLDLEVTIDFDADFRDLFEVRGTEPEKRGTPEGDRTRGPLVVLGYVGRDGIVRRTELSLGEAADEEGGTRPVADCRVAGRRFVFPVHLEPRQAITRELTIRCTQLPVGAGVLEGGAGDDGRLPEPAFPAVSFSRARDRAAAYLCSWRDRFPRLSSSNPLFDEWWNRSLDDVSMLITRTPNGPYPYAGVPWFSAPFGRDGIVTALQSLWAAPFLARGVLSYLADTQAREVEPARDAEPGKILHEGRRGEMANLGEVPFGRYYGSVDATPLFLLLAGAYWRRTGDREFLEAILPAVEAALEWIDRWGDADEDGFVEYRRRARGGLVNQGWKDSHDAVFGEDGRLAEGPIALVEVQAYVYGAKLGLAELFDGLGRKERARRLRLEASELQRRFEDAFWCDDLGCYVAALDRAKRPLRVRTSNAGHALFTGIAAAPRARRVARTLLGKAMFSGWGVRTLASDERRYNPMSYHNGSIWPHDNALIAWGLRRYGGRNAALRLLTAMFDASLFMDLHRLPELFCGFHRRVGSGPVRYPVACSPQAWSAGAVCLLLQAALGLQIDSPRGRLVLRGPRLPSFLDEVRLSGLEVGSASLELRFWREGDEETGSEILPRDGEVEVVRRDGEVDVRLLEE